MTYRTLFFACFWGSLFAAVLPKGLAQCPYAIAGVQVVKPIKEGMVLVQKNKKFGFANATDRSIVVAPKYDFADRSVSLRCSALRIAHRH